MKTLLVVDGNSILNRAFFGIRPLTTKDGLFTQAVYGMINILLRHLDEVKPDYAAVAFDLKAPTFRHKMYDGYKATRKGMPEELAMQLPYAKQACEALGFTLLSLEGYEADDILGTCAKMASDAGIAADILTGDRDSLQLINENVSVLLASTGETLKYGRNEFFEKYGVYPEQYVDVKALMGDSSDNIPGVPGIGEKGAFKLISEFSSLDHLYEVLPGASPAGALTKSYITKLNDGKESAMLSRTLARIVCDVPLGIGLDSLAYHGIKNDEMLALCTRLELGAVIKRLGLTENSAPAAEEKLNVEAISAETLVQTVTGKERSLFFDVEKGTIRVFCENKLYETGIDALPGVIRAPGRTAVTDSKALYSLPGAEDFGDPDIFDLSLAGYVLDTAAASYDIPRLSTAYLGRTPAENYDEAREVARLAPELEKMLTESGQMKLYTDIELPLARVLAEMETRGFKIDRDGLTAFGEKLARDEKECERAVWMTAGEEFNLNSPKQLSEILFDRLGLPGGKKTKSGYSTDAETLEKLRPYHPIIEQILGYRQLSKLRATYADGLLKVAHGDGTVHTSFKQTVTATGRLSSAEPNLQNIPIRTDLGRELRRFFIPLTPSRTLIDADYSQIELRLLAAISGDTRMIGAFASGADIHTETAASVFGVPYEAVTPDMRKKAKAVNFGIMYGIGDYSLSQDIGVSRKRAAEYIESYLSRFPGVQSYLSDTIGFARKNGFVTTIFGRRRYIPELSSPKKQLQAFGERVAMNSPIQGAAADIIKTAMVNVSKRLKEEKLDASLILQVHDELIIDSDVSCADRAAAILKDEMENAVSLAVPLTVEIGIGQTWYDCH